MPLFLEEDSRVKALLFLASSSFIVVGVSYMFPSPQSSPVKTFTLSQHLLQERFNFFENRPPVTFYPTDKEPKMLSSTGFSPLF